RGTGNEFRAAGLAQAALDAAAGALPPFADGRRRQQLQFHPDQDRYRKMYDRWLAEKRDWCISPPLWWGHRLPVWRRQVPGQHFQRLEGVLQSQLRRDGVAGWVLLPDGSRLGFADAFARLKQPGAPASVEVQVCFRDEAQDQSAAVLLQGAGLQLDPDVL